MSDKQELKCPEALELWTLDEVAECLNVSEGARLELWGKLATVSNHTPLGGDGSNGTVEEPSGRLDGDNGDKLRNCWDSLSESTKKSIIEGYESDPDYGPTGAE